MSASTTEIIVLLDRSGSMASIRAATIDGFNAFVKEQRETPGDGVMSLIQFDSPEDGWDWYTETFHRLPEKEVPLLTVDNFIPRGCTALIDATCRVLDEFGKTYKKTNKTKRPGKVLFVIITDGLENASEKYGKEWLEDNPDWKKDHHYRIGFVREAGQFALKERIEYWRDTYGFQFIYLGANQNAILEGAKYGIPNASSMTYKADNQGTQTMFRGLSKTTQTWKKTGETVLQGV